jgi:hypothetical protein
MVVECAREDVPISNWKENGSELTSQRFEVLELRRKLRDDVLESVFAYPPPYSEQFLYISQYTNDAVYLSSVSPPCWVFACPYLRSHIECTSIRRRKKMTRGRADMCDLCLQEPRSPCDMATVQLPMFRCLLIGGGITFKHGWAISRGRRNQLQYDTHKHGRHDRCELKCLHEARLKK